MADTDEIRDDRFGFGPPVRVDEEEDYNQVVRETIEEEAPDGDIEYDDPEEFVEEETQEYHDDTSEEGNSEDSDDSSFLYDNKKYIFLFVVIFGLILAGLFIFGGEFNIEEMLPSAGSGEAQVDPINTINPSLNPQATDYPENLGGGSMQIESVSIKIQNIQNSLLNVVEMVFQGVYILLLLIDLLLFYPVFKDALNRNELKDFKMFCLVGGLVFLSAIIPILMWATIPGSSLAFKAGWVLTMKSLQNVIAAMMALSALFMISFSGRNDLTPIAIGSFKIGTLFWMTQVAMFLAWELPLETVFLWSLGIVLMLIEVVRNPNTYFVIGGVFVASVAEFLLFIGLAEVLELVGVAIYTKWPDVGNFVIAHGQFIGIILSISLIGGILSGAISAKDSGRIEEQYDERPGSFSNRLVSGSQDGFGLFLGITIIIIYFLWS